MGEDSSHNASEWKKFELRNFQSSISKLSWEENGTILAVATSDGIIYLFKEQNEGFWDIVSQMNQEGIMEDVADASEVENNEKI